MIIVKRIFLLAAIVITLSGCALGLFVAHSIEKVGRIKGDRYVNIDMQVQVDQELVNFRSYFTCEQDLRSDAGAGVYEIWDASPKYVLGEHSGKGFWLLSAPNCNYLDLQSYPAYLVYYPSLNAKNPEIHVLDGQGEAKVISKNVRQVDPEPEDRSASEKQAKLIEKFSGRVPKMVTAYVMKRELLRGELDGSVLFNRQQISFFGSPYDESDESFLKKIDPEGRRPDIIRSKEHWSSIHKLSTPSRDELNSLRWRKVYLHNKDGLWVLPSDNAKGSITAFTAPRQRVVINYDGYTFSSYDVKALYDHLKEEIILFDVEYPSYILNKRKETDWKNRTIYVGPDSDFVKAKSTWRNRFQETWPNPEGQFLAYRFKENNQEEMIRKDYGRDIKDRYPIDFNGYYFGYFNVPEWENRLIKVGPRTINTHIRFLVDQKIVYEGPLNKLLTISLNPGSYLVEIEVTAEADSPFWLEVVEDGLSLSREEIAERLKKELTGDYSVLVAGIVKSSNDDEEVEVELIGDYKRAVLFLNSSRKARWLISNPKEVEILAIVYGSSEGGSVVIGDKLNNGTAILRGNKLIPWRNNMFDQCNYMNPHIYDNESCLRGGRPSGLEWFERISGSRIDGYTARTEASSIKLPEIAIKYASKNNKTKPKIEPLVENN